MIKRYALPLLATLVVGTLALPPIVYPQMEGDQNPSEFKTFQIKSGKTLQGKIIFEGPTHYRILTKEGRTEVVFKNKIAETLEIPDKPTALEPITQRKNAEESAAVAVQKAKNDQVLRHDEAPGKTEETLPRLEETAVKHPEDGQAQLNYATVLFAKAHKLFGGPQKEEGRMLFQEVEDKLKLAIQSLEGEKNRQAKADANFLLGEIYFYVHLDIGNGLEFYKSALAAFPQHQPTLDVLKAYGLLAEEKNEIGKDQNQAVTDNRIQFVIQDEKIEMGTDGRSWTEGFKQSSGGQGIIEYVLNGEKVSSWSELVTLNFFVGPAKPGAPKKFADFTQKNLHDLCRQFEWNDIAEDATSITYGWEARGCPGQPDQSEVARVIQGNQGLYVFHYAAKTVPISEEKKATWIRLLGNIEVSKI